MHMKYEQALKTEFVLDFGVHSAKALGEYRSNEK